MATPIGMAFVAELNKNKMLIMSVLIKAGLLCSAFLLALVLYITDIPKIDTFLFHRILNPISH